MLALGWTAIAGLSLAWNIHQEDEEIDNAARVSAEIAYEKDIAYRDWNRSLGGLYAQVSERVQPNPYMPTLNRRDLATTDGKKLTLINPAHMGRMVQEWASKQSAVVGHTTSFTPIRPEAAPDAWEKRALTTLMSGKAVQVEAIVPIGGEDYLRLMRPLIAEPSCMECHTGARYQAGVIVGGISESVPMSPLRDQNREHVTGQIVGHASLWLLGLAGIIFGARRQGRLEGRIRKLSMVIEQCPVAVLMADADGRIIYQNPEAVRRYGLNEAQLLPDGLKLVSPSGSEGVGQRHHMQIWQHLCSGGTWSGELTCRTHDGSPAWEDVSLFPVEGVDGRSTKFVAIRTDITERKRASETERWEREADRAISEISRWLLTSSDLSIDEVSNIILKHGCRLTESGLGHVGYIDPETGKFMVFASDTYAPVDGADGLETKTGLFGMAMVHREPLVFNGPPKVKEDGAAYSTAQTGTVPVRRFVLAPALVEGHLIGQIAFADARRDYTDRDALIIGRLADLYAIAFRNSQAIRERKTDAERLRLVVEATNDGIWDWDLDRNHSFWSDRVHTFLGCSARQAVPSIQSIRTLLHSHDRDLFEQGLADTLDRGKPLDIEVRLRRMDSNRFRWFSMRGKTVVGSDGRYMRLVASISDIDSRKGAERALAEQLSLHQALIEAIPNPIFYKGSNRLYIGCNRGFAELLGRSRSEIVGQAVFDVASQASAQIFYDADTLLLESGGTQVFEAQIGHADGSRRDMHISKATFSVTGDAIDGIVGVMIDITERKQLEEKLRKMVLAVEQSPVSIMITDPEGRIEYVNPKFVSSTQYQPEEVIGSTPRFLKSGYTSEDQYQSLWCTISAGNIWRGELHNRRKDGSLFWEAASISPMRSANGTITNFVAVKEDMTDRKQREIDLLVATEKAEVGNRAKAQFLAMMSHELRTPLNSIIGFSDLILTEQLGPLENQEYKSFVEEISVSGRSLLTLINNLLDMTKIASGDISLHTKPFPVQRLIDESVQAVRGRAEMGRLHFTVNTRTSMLWLDADEQALRQALVHLLANAIKFTPANGSVELSSHVEADGGLALSVADTGIGIDPESVEKVMKPFVQGDNSLNRRFEGAGLGLPMASSIIAGHGGRLMIDSKLGVGTTVVVLLPNDRVRFSANDLRDDENTGVA